MKKTLKRINYIFKHKLAIYSLWKTQNTKVPLIRVILHDLDKIILIPLIGNKRTTKFHRKYIRHHNIKTDVDFYEAYLDWASARITKPDKPLDALQTAEKYFPKHLQRCINHYKSVNYK